MGGAGAGAPAWGEGAGGERKVRAALVFAQRSAVRASPPGRVWTLRASPPGRVWPIRKGEGGRPRAREEQRGRRAGPPPPRVSSHAERKDKTGGRGARPPRAPPRGRGEYTVILDRLHARASRQLRSRHAASVPQGISGASRRRPRFRADRSRRIRSTADKRSAAARSCFDARASRSAVVPR